MLTTDRNDPRLQSIRPNGQQEAYLVLSDEDLVKEFVRPVRRSYIHLKCGVLTTMGRSIAETYARNPTFYGEAFCCGCEKHFPLVDIEGNRTFSWDDSEEKVGE